MTSSALLYLDLFVDRSFLWRNPLDGRDLPHRMHDWTGVIHHPPGVPNSCDHLFNSVTFQDALANCVSLIVFSETLQLHVQTLIQLWGLCHRDDRLHNRRLPTVYFVHHPVNVDLLATFRSPDLALASRHRLFHIGHHGRDIERFYRLAAPGFEKIILTNDLNIPDHICMRNASRNSTDLSSTAVWDFPPVVESSSFHPPDRKMYKAKFKRGSVAYSWSCCHQPCRTLPRLSRKQYVSLLNSGIVYIHLIDASAVNTLLECIVMRTPVFVNRLPAVEEMLGMTYPLYAETELEVADILNRVDLRHLIDQTVDYLSRLDLDRFHIRHVQKLVCTVIDKNDHKLALAPVLDQLDHIGPCRLLHSGGKKFRLEFRKLMEPAARHAQNVRRDLRSRARVDDCTVSELIESY